MEIFFHLPIFESQYSDPKYKWHHGLVRGFYLWIKTSYSQYQTNVKWTQDLTIKALYY